MFDGTSWKFRILYFVSSMIPAYFLFLYTQCGIGDLEMLGYSLVSVAIVWFLCRMIESRGDEGIKISKYSPTEIKSKNGEIHSFLLGVILPSVINVSDSFKTNLITFIILQICLFVLMIKTTSILPNIPLIIVGLNVFEMDDGKFILTFRKKLKNLDENEFSIARLGDEITCHTYIRKRK